MKHARRVLAALSTAALVVLALLYAPVRLVQPVLVVVAGLVHLEFCQMISRKYAVRTAPSVLAGVLYLAASVYHVPYAMAPIVFLLAMVVLFGRGEKPVEELATTSLGFLYLPVMLSYFVRIPGAYGSLMLLYIIAIVKFSDMGGFALGVAFGRHKMCPSISPNKSWEGLFGSFLAGVVMSLAFLPLTGFTPAKAVAFGLVAAAAGTLGDLVESRMKRECGVKDSATFMPAGLGGFLDMFDSLVFAPALLYSFI